MAMSEELKQALRREYPSRGGCYVVHVLRVECPEGQSFVHVTICEGHTIIFPPTAVKSWTGYKGLTHVQIRCYAWDQLVAEMQREESRSIADYDGVTKQQKRFLTIPRTEHQYLGTTWVCLPYNGIETETSKAWCVNFPEGITMWLPKGSMRVPNGDGYFPVHGTIWVRKSMWQNKVNDYLLIATGAIDGQGRVDFNLVKQSRNAKPARTAEMKRQELAINYGAGMKVLAGLGASILDPHLAERQRTHNAQIAPVTSTDTPDTTRIGNMKMKHLSTAMQTDMTTVKVAFTNTSQWYTYKVPKSWKVAIDDLALVESNGQYKMVTIKEVDLVPDIDYDADYTYAWLVAVIPNDVLNAHKVRKQAELDFIKLAGQLQRLKAKEEILETVPTHVKDSPELRELLRKLGSPVGDQASLGAPVSASGSGDAISGD